MTANIRLISVILFSFAVYSPFSSACEKSPYLIGVEDIDYSPHYNFVDSSQPSYFQNFIDWLELKTNCKFHNVPLPLKRLKIAFEIPQQIDFIYPDNPNWHTGSKKTTRQRPRTFSRPIATALGGTMVAVNNSNITPNKFDVLVFPRGFTPVAWLPLKDEYQISFKEVNDAKAALMMVQAGRATGADIEYNVAQYLIQYHELEPMALAKNLPFVPTDFQLSTVDNVEMIEIISRLIEENSDELSRMKQKAGLLEVKP